MINKRKTQLAEENKINSLLQLVDDPDVDIFESVSNAILDIGLPIIEPLEHLWEVAEDENTQKRILHLIKRVQLQLLKEEWKEWRTSQGHLLDAMILIAKMRYPQIDKANIQLQYAKMKDNIWLELNAYLSPLEQLHVINGILYSYYRLQGKETHQAEEDTYYINKLFETKIGNAYSISMLIFALMDDLDIPIKSIELPYQLVMAYFESVDHFLNDQHSVVRIAFYLDPNNGYIFTQREIESYFKKIDMEQSPSYFVPLTKEESVYLLLEQLMIHFESENKFEASNDVQDIIDFAFDDIKPPSQSDF